MSDPAATTIAFDGFTASGVSVLGAFLLVLIWAFRESLTLLFQWAKAKMQKPPATAVGSTTKPPGTDVVANRPLIEDHFFFATVEELIKSRVPELTCGCEVRTRLLRDMMTEYLAAWRDYFSEFVAAEINDLGFESKTPRAAAQFANRVSTMLLDLREEIEDRWVRRGVPPEAIAAFSAWNHRLVDLATVHSNKVVYGVFFNTNRHRLIVMMAQHALFLSAVMAEATIVLRSMNGSLSGKVYAGAEIAALDNTHCDDLAPKPKGRNTPVPHKLRSGEWRAGKRVAGTDLKLPITNPDREP